MIFQYADIDGNPLVTITHDADGLLNAYRGDAGGTLLETSADPLVEAVYYDIEVKVLLDAVAGTVEVRVWPDEFIANRVIAIDFTGDTGSGFISAISYGITGASPVAHWGDKWTCDLSGSDFNDFLGNKSILCVVPTGPGSEDTWIPTPTVPNWENAATSPPALGTYNAAPNIDFSPSASSDLLTHGAAMASTVDAVVANLCAREIPEVEVVDNSAPTAFGVDPIVILPLTTTGPDTKTGNLILVSLVVFSDDSLATTPTQTGFTLLTHQRTGYGDSSAPFFHYLTFWATAAGDGAVEYDFSEAVGAFTLNPETEAIQGYVTNAVLRNQTGSWEFDTVEAQQNGLSCPLADCPPVTMLVPGTAAPDTFGHFNYLVGFSPFLSFSGSYTVAPSSGFAYNAYDNGTTATNNGVFAFGLRSKNGVASPDLTLTLLGARGPFNNGGVTAVSFDIKPVTTPVGVTPRTVGALSDDVESYGVIPTSTPKIFQFPFETAPDAGAWTTAKFNAAELGYRIDADLPPTEILTVTSTNPVSGTEIAIVPDDMNGDSDGETPFTREYVTGTPVLLTAPATATGNAFSKWKKDTVDDAVTEAVIITMDADRQMQAVYSAASCPVGNVLIKLDGGSLSQGDGTEVTLFPDEGIHAYDFIPIGIIGTTGPLYDTTATDNLRFSVQAGASRGLKSDGPVDVDLGLPGAFTMIFVVEADAITATSREVFQVDDGGVEGWEVALFNLGGGLWNIGMRCYGDGDGTFLGGIFSTTSFSFAGAHALVGEIVCDGVNVRILINGTEEVGVEWFNDGDSSTNYSPCAISAAATAAMGIANAAFISKRLFGNEPFFQINNVNLSDADRQAIAVAQAATYGITYTPGSCSVGCVA